MTCGVLSRPSGLPSLDTVRRTDVRKFHERQSRCPSLENLEIILVNRDVQQLVWLHRRAHYDWLFSA